MHVLFTLNVLIFQLNTQYLLPQDKASFAPDSTLARRFYF